MNNYSTVSGKAKHTSELSKNVTFERFKKALIEFMNQADKNAVSKKAHGGKKPSGFIDTYFDGADFHTHFGQGAASKAPYLNWWALSIYYIVEDQSIVMGIERNRYPHLNQLEFSRYKKVPGKEDVAVFYTAPKEQINYAALYEKFISIAEEIMRLGLLCEKSKMEKTEPQKTKIVDSIWSVTPEERKHAEAMMKKYGKSGPRYY